MTTYVVGEEITSGTVLATDSTGAPISVTPGVLYALENTDGPWYAPAGPFYSMTLRMTSPTSAQFEYGGIYEPQPPTGAEFGLAFSERITSAYVRIFFTPPVGVTQVYTRVGDQQFGDNSGSMGYKLSYAYTLPAAPISRETGRDKIATLLNSALVSGTVKAVYNYPVGDPEGAWPFIIVSSASSQRRHKHLGAVEFDNIFRYTVSIFTSAADSATSWTETAAFAQLNAIEKAVSDVIADNQATDVWYFAELEDGFTTIQPAFIANKRAWMETLNVLVRVKD